MSYILCGERPVVSSLGIVQIVIPAMNLTNLALYLNLRGLGYENHGCDPFRGQGPRLPYFWL